MTDRLTPKQEAFCVAYCETRSATRAYRSAYDAEGMKDSTVRPKASGLLSQGKIRARIEELRAQVAERAVVDTAWVVERTVQVVERSIAEGKLKDATPALALLAKHVGGFTDRVEHSGNVGMTVERRTPPLDDDDGA